jgi:hypothetical protein
MTRRPLRDVDVVRTVTGEWAGRVTYYLPSEQPRAYYTRTYNNSSSAWESVERLAVYMDATLRSRYACQGKLP